jgi:Mor family transcriptional regulator
MEKWMQQLKVEDLPEVYQSLAESLGVNGVIKLAENFGGTYMYIPKPDKLLRVARDAAIMKEYQNGVSIRELAKKFSLTDSRIRTIISEFSSDNQITIFDVESDS